MLLDIKIGVGAGKKTVFRTSFDCCRFQGKFSNFEINEFLRKEMTLFNFMCDVAVIELMKLDIKKYCYSVFIKY